jgi:hypothetical protein
MFMHSLLNNRFFQLQSFKSLFATASILVLLFSMIPTVSTARGQSQNTGKALPVFDINKTDYNFGDVFLGESMTASFTVRNLGAAPLELAENPIVTGKPTVGVYRQPLRRSPQQTLRDLLVPAAMPTGVPPYT